MKLYARISDSIIKVFDIITFVGIFSSLIILFVQVVARYFFRYGIIWTDDYARFFMVWFVMLCTASLVRDKSHIRLTLMESILPKQFKPVIDVICQLAFITMAVIILLYSGAALSVAAKSVSSNMPIPMNYVYLSFPVAAVTIIIHAVYNILATFLKIPDETDKNGEISPEAEV